MNTAEIVGLEKGWIASKNVPTLARLLIDQIDQDRIQLFQSEMSVSNRFLVAIFLEDSSIGEHAHADEEDRGSAKRQKQLTFEANRAHGEFASRQKNPEQPDGRGTFPAAGHLCSATKPFRSNLYGCSIYE